MHFLIPSLSPYATPRDVAFATAGPRALETTCTQVFSREHQLLRADPRNSTYLACGMLFRGAVTISDVQRNLSRIKPTLRMVSWNPEASRTSPSPSFPPLTHQKRTDVCFTHLSLTNIVSRAIIS
jgi:tubulin epsilon